MAAVRDLHGRGVGIAIDRDHLDAEALQLDGDLLAQLARAQQHDADGGVGKGGAQANRHSRALTSATTASAVMPNFS